MPSARKRGARSPAPPPARGPLARNRAFVGAILVLAIAAGVWLLRSRSPIADLHAVRGQNVLLVTIDTLRADALSVEGGAARTPALDRLAGEGVRFDFAHAHAVLTLPSHVSILTGEYPFMHGVRENAGYRLAPDAQTLATRFKAAGYATGAFVGAFPLHSRFGLNIGFDAYDDKFGETRAPTEFVMPERPATAVVALARAWIASHQPPATSNQRPAPSPQPLAPSNQPPAPSPQPLAPSNQPPAPSPQSPWFAWVHVFDPHAPYRPPPPFDTEYAGRPYYGEVAATDAALAPLFDDVRASGRPTLVIVTGDHGEALGDHGEQSHGLFAYESTLRVPLIVAELGATAVRRGWLQANGGELSHAAARHVDIAPTALEAAGLPVPPDLPGRSLLHPEDRRRDSARPSYFEAMSGMLNRGWAPLTGVLAGRDKYIDLPIAERYDLVTDTAERHNLDGRDTAHDRRLAAVLGEFHAALPGERRAESRETTAQLRALGYVSGSAARKTRYGEDDDPKRLVDVDAAVHSAVEAFSSGRAADAVRIYQQVIDRRPGMAIAYRHLAFVEWERGNPNGAIATLERALAAGATNDSVVTQLGEYLAESGQPAKAIALVAPIAGAAGADPDTLNALGIAYAHAGKADAARNTFERVLQVNPESSIPLENLGILALERGDMTNARVYFERAVQADPRSSRAHGDLGVVALKAGDRQKAVDEWKEAVRLDPTNYDALYDLGTTLARDGQGTAARPYLQQFLRSAPASFYEKDRREIEALLKNLR